MLFHCSNFRATSNSDAIGTEGRSDEILFITVRGSEDVRLPVIDIVFTTRTKDGDDETTAFCGVRKIVRGSFRKRGEPKNKEERGKRERDGIIRDRQRNG
ncbi:hypothetical protein PoB_005316900 [Plakobranchus ocellatus]|uniref:Uncharacterized protein n=1 Tax=Plakobranchus ocellatus TaxID=259542 RepID=A0AAV4C6I7_9GAST|nr:hypothetical protein PoB_005316900 [Plakobranchus ocellatus]